MNDILTGDAIKAMDDAGKVGGYLVRFGAPDAVDLVGDYFTRDTDFGHDEWPVKTRVYYNHGLDDTLKRRRIANGSMRVDDVGVWVEAQLTMRDEYEKAIFDLVKAGKMGWSSGTAPHLVEREPMGDAKHVTAWPLGLDASITPTPAEWRNGAWSLKSYFESDAAAETVEPEGEAATSSAPVDVAAENATPELKAVQEEPMEPEVKAAAPEMDVQALIAEAVKAALNAQPPVNRAPSVNVTGLGEDGDGVKAFMHYMRTGDEGAVRSLKAYNDTDMNVGTAADGGYAVPTPLYNQIIAKRDEMSILPQMGMMQVPGKGLTARVPIDNEADVVFASVAEAGSVLQDAPAISYKDFTLVKYGKTINLSWELLRDEDANLQSFLSNWVARGLAATENTAIMTELRASGTAGLTLDVATAVGYTEIPEMVGKLAPEYQANAKWILNPATVAYIQGVNSASSFLFAPGATSYAGMPSLWGFPVIQTAQASSLVASAKSLIFGDFSFVGYRRSTSLTVIRDPYTVANLGQLRLVYWFDFVPGVLQAEAIQYATHPSA
jgi:HK97 family phage major capsid protein